MLIYQNVQKKLPKYNETSVLMVLAISESSTKNDEVITG